MVTVYLSGGCPDQNNTVYDPPDAAIIDSTIILGHTAASPSHLLVTSPDWPHYIIATGSYACVLLSMCAADRVS